MLTNKKDIRPPSKAGVILEKIPERATGSPQKTFNSNALKQTLQPESNDIPTLKTIKLTDDEKVFIKDYRRLEDLEREKEIKFF